MTRLKVFSALYDAYWGSYRYLLFLFFIVSANITIATEEFLPANSRSTLYQTPKVSLWGPNLLMYSYSYCLGVSRRSFINKLGKGVPSKKGTKLRNLSIFPYNFIAIWEYDVVKDVLFEPRTSFLSPGRFFGVFLGVWATHSLTHSLYVHTYVYTEVYVYEVRSVSVYRIHYSGLIPKYTKG